MEKEENINFEVGDKMKIPLRFQVTEFDCGTVSLLNAFSYLFNRDEIPAELVKAIHKYTLDCYDENGNLGQGGTSREAINRLTHWITRYANSKNFNVHCERLEKEDVTIDRIIKTLNEGGCVFIRCYQECEHYVIITKIKNKYAYLFDPYYLDKDEYNHDKEVKIILNKPFTHNRKVTLKRLTSTSTRDFALGPVDKRECVLITRTDK